MSAVDRPFRGHEVGDVFCQQLRQTRPPLGRMDRGLDPEAGTPTEQP